MHESEACSRFAVAPYLSTLRFEGKSTAHPIEGSATNLAGFVEAAFAADGTLLLDPVPKMTVSFPVERLKSGNALQDAKMYEMVGSRRFPMVTAELCTIAAGPSGGFNADGDVSLAGKTKRYAGTMTVKRDGKNVVVDGTLTIDIRDFGLEPPKVLFLKVEPQLKILLHLIATGKA